MSIRLRRIPGVGLVALCAARSIEQPGDLYLDDEVHYSWTPTLRSFMHEDEVYQLTATQQLELTLLETAASIYAAQISRGGVILPRQAAEKAVEMLARIRELA